MKNFRCDEMPPSKNRSKWVKALQLSSKQAMADDGSRVKVEEFQEAASVAVTRFFKGFQVPQETKFDLYRKRGSKEEFLLHGENSRLEYEGTTHPLSSQSTQHVVGLYDPESKSIKLYKAPLATSKAISKLSKQLAGPRIKSNEVRSSVLRNALGEAFGTKKAKKAIADLERNRVDSDKLVDAAVDIVDSVKTTSKDLPSRSQLEQSVAMDRPTPVANVDATDVEQIYPIYNIIPKREFNFIHIGPIIKEEDQEKKLEMLPYTGSTYVSKKLNVLSKQQQTQKLQLLYYLALLWGVFVNKRVNNKIKLMERLNSPPEALVDGILDRFTIGKSGQFGRSKERSFFIDPQCEDRIICYILAIVLHLDNFLVEIPPLARELGLKPSKLTNLFRILGATVQNATVAQAEAFGIPKSSAQTYKVAVLKVPFKLPDMVRRGRGPRR